MNSSDQTIAKLLQDSHDMIVRFQAMVGENGADEVSAQVQKATMEYLEEALEPTADAFFDLFVEDDAMTAVAEFRPPSGEGRPLGFESIEASLTSHGVIHGLQWEAIKDALQACNLDGKFQTIVAARGTVPVPSVPAHLRLEPLVPEKAPVESESQTVDFKAITPFVMVKQSQLLARQIPEVPGSPGTDVRGREIPSSVEARPVLTPGENVTKTSEGFQAAVDGRLVVSPPTFAVSPVLELREGVDYKTGNIHFKGDVLVLGRVAAGFTLEAGGSLSCRQVLDAYLVTTGGDVVAPGGIIGNGDGRLTVGGSVSAKFLEHCYIVAQGSVTATSCVLHSVVKARGTLVLGDKGILAGGQVHTLDGVDVFQIGTATGPRTELFVGLDFVGMERILWLRERSRELHSHLTKVDAAMPHAGSRTAELAEAGRKLRAEIEQLTESAREQLMKLGQNDGASVVVRGSVFPGTHIEICHVKFSVNQKMSAVRFFLDKRKGVVGVASLSSVDPEGATRSGATEKKH